MNSVDEQSTPSPIREPTVHTATAAITPKQVLRNSLDLPRLCDLGPLRLNNLIISHMVEHFAKQEDRM
jgi:hypothetical protein